MMFLLGNLDPSPVPLDEISDGAAIHPLRVPLAAASGEHLEAHRLTASDESH